jgi:hypothetical protein
MCVCVCVCVYICPMRAIYPAAQRKRAFLLEDDVSMSLLLWNFASSENMALLCRHRLSSCTST